jgi:hypothetical protein
MTLIKSFIVSAQPGLNESRLCGCFPLSVGLLQSHTFWQPACSASLSRLLGRGAAHWLQPLRPRHPVLSDTLCVAAQPDALVTAAASQHGRRCVFMPCLPNITQQSYLVSCLGPACRGFRQGHPFRYAGAVCFLQPMGCGVLGQDAFNNRRFTCPGAGCFLQPRDVGVRWCCVLSPSLGCLASA